MVELELTTWQRIALSVSIEGLPGRLPIGVVRSGFKLVDILELTAEEKRKVKFVPLSDGRVRFENNAVWPLELPKKHVIEVFPLVIEIGFEMNRQSAPLEAKLKAVLEEAKKEA